MQNQGSLSSLLIKIVTYSVLLFAKVLFWKKKQRIWLIACGGERWGDNADVFWRFMNKNHPEIKTLAVVKNKIDFNTSQKHWIKRNKLSSFILILQAEVLATTHTLSDIGPDSLTFLSKAKKIWLQHGVIAIGKLTAEKAKAGQYDLICASSRKEEEIMTGELGIKSEIIAITGLARHDILKEKLQQGLPRTREGIIYIPTSRTWFRTAQKKKYEELLFSWIDYLMDENEKKEIKIWLHPGWYKHGSNMPSSPCGKVQNFGVKHDPQQLICESKLLITDYSSAFFDAALSGIPTIFYQPDRLVYIKKKGLFKDFLDQDLLLVIEDEHELLLQINKMNNNSDYYKDRVKKDQEWAFQYVETFDGRSCQRIYQQTVDML